MHPRADYTQTHTHFRTSTKVDSNLLLEPPYLSPRPAPHLVAVGTANPVRGRRGIPDLLPHRLARGPYSARKAPAISMKSDPRTPWPASLPPKSNSPSALGGALAALLLEREEAGQPPSSWKGEQTPGSWGSLARGFLPCFRGLSERMSHLAAVATPAVPEPQPPYLGCKQSGCQ